MIQELDVDGATGVLHVAVRMGDSNAGLVLLVHGLNGSADHWRAVMNLVEPGPTIAALDLRGHGQSTVVGPYSSADYADDARRVGHGLGYRQWCVVGSSFGGAVALRLAADHPTEIGAVGLLGTARKGSSEALEHTLRLLREQGPEAYFTLIARNWSLTAGAPTDLIDDVVRWSLGRPCDVIEEVLRAGFTEDLSPLARDCRCPVVVAVGEADRTCPPDVAGDLASALGVPLQVFPRCGHLPMVEAPLQVARFISQVIAAEDK